MSSKEDKKQLLNMLLTFDQLELSLYRRQLHKLEDYVQTLFANGWSRVKNLQTYG